MGRRFINFWSVSLATEFIDLFGMSTLVAFFRKTPEKTKCLVTLTRVNQLLYSTELPVYA
jgi:hypothetical protein